MHDHIHVTSPHWSTDPKLKLSAWVCVTNTPQAQGKHSKFSHFAWKKGEWVHIFIKFYMEVRHDVGKDLGMWSSACTSERIYADERRSGMPHSHTWDSITKLSPYLYGRSHHEYRSFRGTVRLLVLVCHSNSNTPPQTNTSPVPSVLRML